MISLIGPPGCGKTYNSMYVKEQEIVTTSSSESSVFYTILELVETNTSDSYCDFGIIQHVFYLDVVNNVDWLNNVKDKLKCISNKKTVIIINNNEEMLINRVAKRDGYVSDLIMNMIKDYYIRLNKLIKLYFSDWDIRVFEENKSFNQLKKYEV